jgi:hypothetical protein
MDTHCVEEAVATGSVVGSNAQCTSEVHEHRYRERHSLLQVRVPYHMNL